MVNEFRIQLSAILDKVKSRTQIISDIKGLGDIHIPLIGKLDKAKTKAQIEQDLSNMKIDVEVNAKVNKGNVTKEVQDVIDQAQRQVNNRPLEITMALKKEKLVNDIKSFGQQNSKLFKDASMSSKYYQLLDDAQFATSSQDVSHLRFQLSALNSEIKATNLSGLSLGDTLKKTFKRSAELAGSFGTTMAISQQLRKAWQEAITLDTTYTKLIKVQDELSRGAYPAYLEKCNQKAKELASSQKALMEATEEFSKSGYGLNQAEKLTEKSTILANVGEMSASDSAKAIISGIQAYETIDEFSDVEKKAEALIDKYNEIGNTASITTAEIAKGVQAVGSVFADANTGVDELISLMAAGNRQFADANSLALGLRTSALRIRGCTSELKEMGEETDDVIESTSKLADKIKALTNVDGSGGVKILEDDEKTFRNIYDIYVDIGKVYKQMSDVDQSSLLDLIAGKHRSRGISAVLNNMTEAQEIYQNSLNSTGSAQREYEKYLESTEAAISRFGAAMTETYQSVINGETVKGITNCGSATLQFANDLGLVESTMKGFVAIGLVKVITTLSTAFKASAIQASNFGTALNTVKSMSTMTRGTTEYVNTLKNLKTISGSLSETQLRQVLSNKALSDSERIAILRTTGLTKAQSQAKLTQMGLITTTNTHTVANTGATASTFKLSAAIKGLGVSIKAAFMSNPVGISLMAISVAIGAVTSKMSEYKQKLDDARQANIETSNTAAENAKNLTDLSIKYNELSSVQHKTSSQEEDFKAVIDDITKALGNKALVLKDLTTGTEEYTAALQNVTKAELESYYADAKVGAKAAEDALKGMATGNLGESKITIEPIGEIKNVKGADSHNAALNEIRSLMSEFEAFGYNGLEWQPINPSDMESVVEYYQALVEARNKLATTDDSELLMSSDIYKDINTTVVDLTDTVDTYIKQQYEAYKIGYQVSNGLPKTTEEFKIMKTSILDTVGGGDKLKEKISELLDLDFSDLVKGISDVKDNFNYVVVTPISKSGMIAKINELSSGFESLDKIMASVKGKNPFDYSLLDNKDFKETFGEMGESYVNFIEQISNSPNDINACQSAFNELLTTWLKSTGILNNVTDETANLTAAMLSNMGITNAEVVVTDALNANKIAAKLATIDFTKSVEDQIDAMRAELETYNLTANELDNLTIAYANAQNSMTTALSDGVAGRMNILESELQAIKGVADAYNLIAGKINESISKTGDTSAEAQRNFNTNMKLNSGLDDQVRAVIDYGNEMDRVQALIDNATNSKGNMVYGGGTNSNKPCGSKKSKEEAEKEIDWAERTLKQLKEQRDELEKKSSSSFLAYLGLTPEEFEKARLIVESTDTLMTKDLRELRDIAQNAGMSMYDLIDLVENGGDTESKRSYLSQLIEHDKLALRTYDFAIDAYRKKYDELAKNISSEDLNKIENNSMDISLYSGDDAKKIEDVIDAYEKWKNTVKGKAELEAEANDNIKNYYDNNIEYLDHQAKRIESTNSLINSQINYLKESGQIVSATSYEQLISNNKQIISYYEQKIKEAEKKLAELMSREDFDINSKEYYDIQEEMAGYRQVIIDTDVEVQQLANDLLNLPIDNMDIVISMYESITDTIQRWGSEMEASGKKLDKEYYQSLIKNGMTVIDQYKEQYDLVRDVMDEYDTGSEKWNTLYNKLQSINSAMSSMVENLYKWNEALLQLPFDSVSTLSDNLTKALSAMTNVQSEYDTVISAVVGALQEEIDLLNEARDAANEETEAQIDELKSRLDLLNQQNEALKLQAAYEQALYDLQNANTQKTERVIRNGELVYEQNAENLKNAKEKVQDALLDLEKYNLEQEIEALEEQLDAVNDQYEEQIKNLEKISEKWSEITSKIEQAKNEVTATDILGNGWKDKVLSGNDDDIFNMFSGMYQSISDQITLYEDQIASTENIEALLQDYITAYKEGTITYEQAMTGINGLLSQLNEKMSATDNLNNVLDYLGTVAGTDDNSVGGILSALQKSLQETGDELIKSFELYNENAGNISEYTTSWQQLTIDVSDIKDILEEVRDNLEDTLDNISRNRDRDEDLEDDIGVTSSGTITSGIDHSNYGPSFGTESPQYAKGMENGLVGANTDSNREGILKKMVLNRIEDPANAVSIIAHEGEAILNRSQQDTLIENYYNAYESYPSIPDWFANYKMPTYDFSGIGEPSGGDINYNIGDINIEKCDTPDQLAKGIMNGGLKLATIREIGRQR